MPYSPSFLFKKLKEKFRYGLIMHVVYDYLAKVGIKIMPFFWMKEIIPERLAEDLTGTDDFVFSMFTQEDIDAICQHPDRLFVDSDRIQRIFKEGKICYGAKVNGEIAGFTWINLVSCESHLYQIPMNENEAYLFDMFILKAFRGKKLAAILRYKTYKLLKEMGRDVCYSITLSYNTPSIKFKEKLNAQFVFKGFAVNLFNKYEKMWITKRY